MTHELDKDSPVSQEDLIAYLDGELDSETRQKIERRLVQDPRLVQRMREHQQAWDLLDELPREEISEDFAQTTLQMVTVAAASDIEENAHHAATRRRLWIGTIAASLIAASLAGFWIASSMFARPNRQLLQDLPVIENLEAIQQIDSIEFLRALEDEGLFVAEVEDEK